MDIERQTEVAEKPATNGHIWVENRPYSGNLVNHGASSETGHTVIDGEGVLQALATATRLVELRTVYGNDGVKVGEPFDEEAGQPNGQPGYFGIYISSGAYSNVHSQTM